MGNGIYAFCIGLAFGNGLHFTEEKALASFRVFQARTMSSFPFLSSILPSCHPLEGLPSSPGPPWTTHSLAGGGSFCLCFLSRSDGKIDPPCAPFLRLLSRELSGRGEERLGRCRARRLFGVCAAMVLHKSPSTVEVNRNTDWLSSPGRWEEERSTMAGRKKRGRGARWTDGGKRDVRTGTWTAYTCAVCFCWLVCCSWTDAGNAWSTTLVVHSIVRARNLDRKSYRKNGPGNGATDPDSDISRKRSPSTCCTGRKEPLSSSTKTITRNLPSGNRWTQVYNSPRTRSSSWPCPLYSFS